MMHPNRRVLLRIGASALITGFSGCIGAQDTIGDSTETESPADHDDHHAKSPTEHRSDHHHESLPSEPSGHAEVTMVTDGEQYHFEPHLVWIESGGSVTWTLRSGSHSTTAYHPDTDRPRRIPKEAPSWDSGILSEQGATFEHSFDVTGVYDYFCIPHETLGMIGSVVVGKPEPHDQSGLAPPQKGLPDEAREAIEHRNKSAKKLLEAGDEHNE